MARSMEELKTHAKTGAVILLFIHAECVLDDFLEQTETMKKMQGSLAKLEKPGPTIFVCAPSRVADAS